MEFSYDSPQGREAARKIGTILAELEISTGCIVKSIDLAAIETTGLRSSGREMEMRVEIELERPPGHHWQK